MSSFDKLLRQSSSSLVFEVWSEDEALSAAKSAGCKRSEKRVKYLLWSATCARFHPFLLFRHQLIDAYDITFSIFITQFI